jgi:hypothetical protein
MKASLSPSQLRITALWAFCEAFLGGILHGFHVPFAGLVLSAFAAICMCAVAMKDFSPGKILHATLLVMIVKLTLSPHTPVTAYFAVLLQGLFGELIFTIKTPYKIASYLIAVFGLMQSAFQKLIVLTVLFGMEGWKALDEFLNSVLETFGPLNTEYSLYIITAYLLLHFIAGLAAGRFASLLPQLPLLNQKTEINAVPLQNSNHTKRKSSVVYWILFILISAVIYRMYADESFFSGISSKPAKLIIRSVIIIVFWYFFLSPLLMMLFRKWLLNRKSAFATETKAILALLPGMKSIILYAWMISAKFKGVKRISNFISTSFRLLLSSPG